MKWLKIAICSIIIIIIIIVIVLLVVLSNENNVSYIVEQEKPGKETEPIKNADIKKVTDRDDYYTIKYILDKYFEYINYIDATASDLELTNTSNAKEIIQNYTKIGIESSKNILDEEYNKEQLTDEKLKTNLSNYKNKNFRIDSIYTQDKALRRTVYFAYITLDYNKQTKVIIKMDSLSNCFSVLPEDYIKDKNYSEKNLNEIEIKDIQVNDYNKYEYITVTDKMMAQSYLEDYGNVILKNVKKSYDILDEEYKKYKFSTLEEYKSYIKNSNKDYEMLRLMEYYTYSKDNYKIYGCKDQYNNVYVFKDIGIMEYTVMLDDYTLENEEFKQKYTQASSRDKGILNIDKFFKMVNMQDYTSAYKVLDEGFKQTYFKTEQDFTNYIKSKTFRYNKVSYEGYSNEISNIHTYKIKVKDATGVSKEEKEFNIVMKLLDETNFAMSFKV